MSKGGINTRGEPPFDNTPHNRPRIGLDFRTAFVVKPLAVILRTCSASFVKLVFASANLLRLLGVRYPLAALSPVLRTAQATTHIFKGLVHCVWLLRGLLFLLFSQFLGLFLLFTHLLLILCIELLTFSHSHRLQLFNL